MSERMARRLVVDQLLFYNRKRHPSTLDYKSPMAFEEVWRRRQQAKAA
jgi:hypothetical protein